MPPKVDIIILTFNGKADTLECLESLSKVDYPACRVTLVDNGSVDGTMQAVKHRFPSVNYIRSEINLRFAGGNNLALERTLREGYDYALLLNNDTVVSPVFLQYLVETAERSSDIGMVGVKMYYYDHPDVLWFAGSQFNINLAHMRHKGIGLKDEGQFEAETEVEFLNGACVLVKCEMLKKIGLLDEEFYLYGEDLDLCLRARKANYKLLYQPRAVIRHKISRSTPAFRKLRYRYQSWWRLCAKHTAFYWRPLQIANLALEFVPLMIGYLKRLLKFNSTLNTQNSKQ